MTPGHQRMWVLSGALGLGSMMWACGSEPTAPPTGVAGHGGSAEPEGGRAGSATQSGASSGGGGSSAVSGGGGSATDAGSAGTGNEAGIGGMATLGPPNVIVVMADDLGYSDLGSYGGEIHTPNIDALANAGLRFSNFYNASRCSPTRAALLTGQYPHRVNLAANGRDLGRNGLTIAEALGAAGYNTALAGKWHLSRTPQLATSDQHLKWLNHQLDPGVPFSPDLTTYPVGRGFQKHYGIIWGVANYWDPFSLVEGTTPIESVPDGYYITQAITEKAVEYVTDFAKEPKPFFLYVAFTAPHFPLHALPEDIAKYEGVYDAGWAPVRQARYDRQVELGLFDPATTPLPPTQGNDWAALSTVQKTFLANAMQTHAAAVDRVDQGVGEIVKALQANGALENTLILFLSDNGASSEIYLQPGYDRPSQTRSGETIQYCGGQAACPYAQPGDQKTYAYLGPSWANAANTPFRYWKGESFRGGNTTPLIAHWPAGLKAKAGSVTAAPAHVIDVLPTLLEIAHEPYPESYQDHELTSLDGTSLLPILEGGEGTPHPRLFFEHEDGAALIEGDFKLVRLSSAPTWELYNLAKDRTETNNLAAAQPARVQSMKTAWQAWYDSVPH
jgi:arylsulfatase A-like enzyme